MKKKMTNSDTMKAGAIARKINTLIAERKQTRAEFAEDAGVSESTLSKWLTCKVLARESTLRYMEEQLGLPHMYFSENIKQKRTAEEQTVLSLTPAQKQQISIVLGPGVWLTIDPNVLEEIS